MKYEGWGKGGGKRNREGGGRVINCLEVPTKRLSSREWDRVRERGGNTGHTVRRKRVRTRERVGRERERERERERRKSKRDVGNLDIYI